MRVQPTGILEEMAESKGREGGSFKFVLRIVEIAEIVGLTVNVV